VPQRFGSKTGSLAPQPRVERWYRYIIAQGSEISMAPNDGRRPTAYHEAGHAVIGRVLGMTCGGATIVPDYDACAWGNAIIDVDDQSNRENRSRHLSALGHSLPMHSAPMPTNVRYTSDSNLILRRSKMTRCAKSRYRASITRSPHRQSQGLGMGWLGRAP